MAAAKRITKHQMKEDKFVTAVFRANEYFQANRGRAGLVIGAVVGAVLLVVVIFGIASLGSGNNEEAMEFMGKATIAYNDSLYPIARVNFEKVVDEFGSADCAPMALNYLANTLYKMGEYEAAAERFLEYAGEYRENLTLRSTAIGGAAVCYDELGQLSRAGELFLEAAEADADGFKVPEYLFNAARIYLRTGEYQKAYDLYHRLTEEYPKSPYDYRAQREMLEAQHKLG